MTTTVRQQSANLTSINGAGHAIMSVETTPTVASVRQSVRITTQFTYTGGLVIMDSVHMPTGCGTWPAFWSNGPNWPAGGEIDIVEGKSLRSRAMLRAILKSSDRRQRLYEQPGYDSHQSRLFYALVQQLCVEHHRRCCLHHGLCCCGDWQCWVRYTIRRHQVLWCYVQQQRWWRVCQYVLVSFL